MEIRGFASRKINFDKLSRRAQKLLLKEGYNDVMDKLIQGASNVRNSAIDSMRKSPPNTTASKYISKGRHYPSFGFNAPRPDSGDLIRSLLMDVDETDLEVRMGSVINDPPYPAYLEFGTDNMAPRPWLEPAYQLFKDKTYYRAFRAMRNAAKRLLENQ